MTTQPPLPNRLTREQYYELGRQGVFDGKRVELIFGKVVEMSPIDWLHRVACRKTAELLEAVFAGVAWIDRGEPIDLTHSDPQPDVAVIPGQFEDYTDHPTAALLIVEVADSTLASDLTPKAEPYATANIPDYWVLDVTGRELHVFRDPLANAALGITTYQSHQTFGSADTVSPLGAPGASVLVSDLLP
jgi:Uma2 family endonuclease